MTQGQGSGLKGEGVCTRGEVQHRCWSLYRMKRRGCKGDEISVTYKGSVKWENTG